MALFLLLLGLTGRRSGLKGLVDANLLGAPGLLLLGTGLVVARGWGLRATAQGIGDELGEALLGVQAAKVKDALHEERHHTCLVHCLCVRPEVQPLATSWHDLILGDLAASTRDVLDADQEVPLHLWDEDGEVGPPEARELRPQMGLCHPAATLDMPLPEHLGEDHLLMSSGGDQCAARDHVAGIEELPDGSLAAALDGLQKLLDLGVDVEHVGLHPVPGDHLHAHLGPMPVGLGLVPQLCITNLGDGAILHHLEHLPHMLRLLVQQLVELPPGCLHVGIAKVAQALISWGDDPGLLAGGLVPSHHDARQGLSRGKALQA